MAGMNGVAGGGSITERTRYFHARVHVQVSCSTEAAVEAFGLEVGNGNTEAGYKSRVCSGQIGRHPVAFKAFR